MRIKKIRQECKEQALWSCLCVADVIWIIVEEMKKKKGADRLGWLYLWLEIIGSKHGCNRHVTVNEMTKSRHL